MKRTRVILSIVAAMALFAVFTLLGSLNILAQPADVPHGCKLVYKWNVIGYPEDQEYTGGCGSGHRMFVNRDANHTHIILRDHNDGWHVQDCNATADNTGELHSDDLGTFDVFVRILGKPGGSIDICAEILFDPDTHDHICELGSINLLREGGRSKLTIQPDAIFDASLFDIIWSVTTNKDYRIAEFRVYDCTGV